MESDPVYRSVPYWTQQEIWMADYSARAQWPPEAAHPLFRVSVTGATEAEAGANMRNLIDWLLDGPCKYAARLDDSVANSLREFSVD